VRAARAAGGGFIDDRLLGLGRRLGRLGRSGGRLGRFAAACGRRAAGADGVAAAARRRRWWRRWRRRARGCAVERERRGQRQHLDDGSQLSPSTRRVSPSPGPSIMRSSPRTFVPTASGARRGARRPRRRRAARAAHAREQPGVERVDVEQPAGASNSTRMATPSPPPARGGRAASASSADSPMGGPGARPPTT
jgi:hypothetical protein